MVEYTGSPYPAFCRSEHHAAWRAPCRLRRQGINLVLIDTPPQTVRTIEAANTAADFVLIRAS